jgi:hypothetical protein
MKHMLIDIETLGLREDLPPGVLPEVTEVGVVIFDPDSGEVTEEYSFFPDPDNGQCSWNTLGWWIEQIRNGHPAPWHARRAAKATDTLAHVCQMIITAWNRNGCKAVWGNDPEMDLAPLEVWMRNAGLNRPWSYFERQDVRTLRNVLGLRAPKHAGQHIAIEDAKAEAAFVSRMLKALEGVAA